ncbi:hypothetical protein P280DRAFT_465852 [Massarina eburnea CBS 473.64]|uniref:Uncharacterized protein n=1 Tax=Massarina eburnea CBS 473.64 TaxID=1395130 RepID=A0A6A6SDR2_9PLEO|nr:hypothetical protein P280DRAFT_465852 [Massarina eburnea CBS 473.64]
MNLVLPTLFMLLEVFHLKPHTGSLSRRSRRISLVLAFEMLVLLLPDEFRTITRFPWMVTTKMPASRRILSSCSA